MSIQLKLSPNIKTLKNITQEKSKQKSSTSKYHIQLLSSFGCDTSGKIKDCINFITKNNYSNLKTLLFIYVINYI